MRRDRGVRRLAAVRGDDRLRDGLGDVVGHLARAIVLQPVHHCLQGEHAQHPPGAVDHHAAADLLVQQQGGGILERGPTIQQGRHRIGVCFGRCAPPRGGRRARPSRWVAPSSSTSSTKSSSDFASPVAHLPAGLSRRGPAAPVRELDIADAIEREALEAAVGTDEPGHVLARPAPPAAPPVRRPGRSCRPAA